MYEPVPGAPQDFAVGQAHLDFFYAMAFAMEAYKPDNWRGGRLVDFNDVSAPFSKGWRRSAIVLRDAGVWFWTLGFEEERRVERSIVTGSGVRRGKGRGEGGSVPAAVAADKGVNGQSKGLESIASESNNRPHNAPHGGRNVDVLWVLEPGEAAHVHVIA